MTDPHRMIAWKVWFEGGVSYCGTDSDPADLPDDGCLGVMLKITDGTKHNWTGTDWYWYCEILGDPGWFCGYREEYPTAEDVIARYPGAIVIRGKWTSFADMRRALDEMARWKG